MFAKELGSWSTYVQDLLAEKGRTDFKGAVVLDVGFGTGHAYEREPLFQSIPKIIAVDLSQTALEQAARHFPNVDFRVDDAERLSTIESRSVDVYFSFRTYSSSLFDRRLAAHHAFRVLRPGGYFIVSIPCLYNDKGKPIPGLGDPDKRISTDYLNSVVDRTAKYFEMLGFSDLVVDRRSPFEVLIYGTKQ